MEEAKKVELTCLLMGKTGHGKSNTGNTLLGKEKAFKESSGTTSETKEVKGSFADFDNYRLTVVDGPGLEDTEMTKAADRETAVANMTSALGLCDGGVDAFLFVTKFGGRFTEEERSALEALKKTFGPDYMNHVIVIMTGGDLFKMTMENEKRTITFDEWCREQTGAFRQLYDNCNGLVVLLNNYEKDEKIKHAQRHKIVQIIEDLNKLNGRYTSESFRAAKAARDKMIVELKKPELDQQFQAKANELTAEIETLKGTAPSPVAGKIILKHIQDLKDEIIKQDMETGVLEDWKNHVAKLEINLHDVEELQRLAESDRHNAEKLQRLAERDRRNAEKIQSMEKSNRLNAEELQSMKESNRLNAEELKSMKESNRLNAEELQRLAERDRRNVEELQRLLENNRLNAEERQRLEEINDRNVEKHQQMFMELVKQTLEQPVQVIHTHSRCTIS